ncbi:unnamed protein product [Polarella glacialis]|uniref:Uncharacterized protein n=1 Tax=Polarella glacialis TaxID=89957 RepID=A0A813IUP7_POLGL|nr:unnamed protein product [Polarella glacialis]
MHVANMFFAQASTNLDAKECSLKPRAPDHGFCTIDDLGMSSPGFKKLILTLGRATCLEEIGGSGLAGCISQSAGVNKTHLQFGMHFRNARAADRLPFSV